MVLEKQGSGTQFPEINNRNPDISICITTYNQANFIRGAIDSVLSQKKDFKYEIIIGDDHSTDGTRDILREYQRQYPDIIKLNLLPEKGKGAPGKENFMSTIEMCKGKYIAVLEGDDYWTVDNKLSIQKKILDENKEYIMCHHACETSSKMANYERENFNSKNNIAGFYDACQITFPLFLSVMFRREGIDNLNLREMLADTYSGDWGLWCLLTLKGKAFYINKKMGYYRVSTEGLSYKIPYKEYISGRINFLRKLLKKDVSMDRKFVFRMLSKLYLLSSGNSLERRNVKSSLSEFLSSLKYFFKGLFTFRSYNWIKRFKHATILKVVSVNIFNFIRGKNNYAILV